VPERQKVWSSVPLLHEPSSLKRSAENVLMIFDTPIRARFQYVTDSGTRSESFDFDLDRGLGKGGGEALLIPFWGGILVLAKAT
jgi:hypothetical protein